MSLIVHLSDLHIAHEPARQSVLFDKLVETVASEREAEASEPVLLVITGDVFDSATDPVQVLIDLFAHLHQSRKSSVTTARAVFGTAPACDSLSMAVRCATWDLPPTASVTNITSKPSFSALDQWRT